MRVSRLCGFAILVCLLFVQPSIEAQSGLASEVSRLVQLLELSQESTVADLGAGSGEVSIEIARQLGPRARVYSTDINSTRLGEIRKAAAAAGLTNVTAIEGAPAATNLPDECCDAIFVRYVYHHFGDPPAMNGSILRSLKPGGRFAVMDAGPRNVTGTVPPSERASGDKHGVVKETVVEELKAAGFEIVQIVPDWPGNLFLVLGRKTANR
jgi:ubiquinone/menaquinone biosynthesis C-methylase UbiE